MSQAGEIPAAAPTRFTPWGEEIQPWQTAWFYLPVLLDLDRAVTRLEKLIWDREYPKHGNVRETHDAIFSSSYGDPLAQWRNQILAVRNQVAALYGIKARTIHDHGGSGLGYILDRGQITIPDPPLTVELNPSQTWL